MSTLDVFAEVLREVAPRALKGKEIAELAMQRRWMTFDKEPARAVLKALSADICTHGASSRFLRVGCNSYTIRDLISTVVGNADDDETRDWLNQTLLMQCSQCGLEKPRHSFSKTGYKATFRSVCKQCRNIVARTRDKELRDSIRLRSSKLLASAKARAKKLGLDFDLDRKWILERLEQWTCEATGIRFDLTASRGWNTPSLDRIKPALGYIKTNTRLVLFALNAACGDWGQERLLEIVSVIQSRAEKEAL